MLDVTFDFLSLDQVKSKFVDGFYYAEGCLLAFSGIDVGSTLEKHFLHDCHGSEMDWVILKCTGSCTTDSESKMFNLTEINCMTGEYFCRTNEFLLKTLIDS
uniref:Uncharacterized protein n=1 Tax=Megaselia scalaris TaxID=36166 RepID=T1GAU2_MEGSC